MSDLYGIPRPDLTAVEERLSEFDRHKCCSSPGLCGATCQVDEGSSLLTFAASRLPAVVSYAVELEAEVERLRRLRDACGSGLADLHSMRKALPYEAQLIVDALRLDLSLPAEAVALIEADRRGEVEYELLPDDTTEASHG